MSRFLGLFVVSVSIFLVVACSRAPQSPPKQATPLRPTASIKDIMDSIVDPSADGIWESVATIVSATGTEERRPRTDKDWAEQRRNAVRLVEASNLLLMEGRQVANPGDKSENPNIELEPPQIQELIDKDRETWIKLAHGLHDAALPALKAIDSKNAEALLDSGEGIDQACENCHLKYWYPNQFAGLEAATKTAK
jgi:hypothetical protein